MTTKMEPRHYILWELSSQDEDIEKFREMVDQLDKLAFKLPIDIMLVKEWTEDTEIHYRTERQNIGDNT